ncbi:MAG: hypothetical protein CMM44_06440 [Rhodospirillaceae bacterium]|mgnify:CR=1 FL=1|nr:hypothetical protein [Rhodospirillaceae bacterium]|tara:strand:+ start:841 stop:1179 length:339 start_codon:yes stop_codon:yes gene_type:complete
MTRTLLLIFLLIITTKGAYSASGQQLRDDCTGEMINKISCLYFLGGFGAAGLEINDRIASNGIKRLWCETNKITWTHRRKIVLDYIDKNPKIKNSEAATVIIDAHIAAFPCK